MNNKGDNSGEINAGLNGDGKWVHLIRPTPCPVASRTIGA